MTLSIDFPGLAEELFITRIPVILRFQNLRSAAISVSLALAASASFNRPLNFLPSRE